MARRSATAARIAQAAASSASQIRIGTVVGYDTGSITVRFAGGSQEAFPYLRRFDPILGESVVLNSHAGAWIVVGGINGSPPDNPVVNGDFATDVTGWTAYDSGVASSVFWDVSAEDGGGNIAVQRNALGDLDTYLQSNAIPVEPGQSWSADCLAAGSQHNVTASIYLGWFASPASVLPTTAAADTFIAGQPIYGLPWIQLRPTIRSSRLVVPAGVTHMRVMLRAQDNNTGGVVVFDRVIARRLS